MKSLSTFFFYSVCMLCLCVAGFSEAVDSAVNIKSNDLNYYFLLNSELALCCLVQPEGDRIFSSPAIQIQRPRLFSTPIHMSWLTLTNDISLLLTELGR